MKKDCSKCYVEVKKYTPIRGIILFTVISILLMIPILNLFITKIICKDNTNENFWEGMWYDLKKEYIKGG